ncbi:MAG: DUF2130 domain-containing protein [Patescibacteria group bacterium]
MNNTIKCPKCGHEFSASEGLISHIKEEASLEVEKRLRKEIESEKNIELQDLKKTLQEKDVKIDDFRKQELEIREEKRKLEDAKKDLELETQRRIDEEKKKIEEDTSKRLLDEHHFKDLEKDKKISDMEKLVEELKRKSQQGSMQTQGEVGELDLEDTLIKLFPTDEISEVKKGERGGDTRQVVKTQRGTKCGMILWERKRTKAWDEKWVSKLKEDMGRDKAHLGVIITEALPKDFKKQIGEKSGIWITTASFVEPLAMLLRKVLYDVAKEKAVKLNKQGKADEIYDFVTSNEFIQQVERMMGIYQDMKGEISKERAVSERQWKLRDMQVNRLITGVSGIYGSMQGIAGSALPQVKNLELPEGNK